MFKSVILMVVVSSLLVGCNFEYFTHLVDSKEPAIVIAGGTVVQISDSETVKVFGTDTCPDSKLKNCVSLSGSSVEVFLEHESGAFVTFPVIESWQIERVGSKVALIRPNGFKVYQPSK
jgi:hypothetical protein